MAKTPDLEPAKIKLTNKDKQLLMLLQNNARESNASLARTIGVSRATIQERIQRLEAAGVIEGYSVKINQHKIQNNIDAIVMLLAENKTYAATFDSIEKMPYIKTIHSLSGEWDWSLYISAPTIDEFHHCITQINALAGVKSTVSHIIMKTRLDRRSEVKIDL
jgi:DNA-binding Lrp family transcriptional regulator